MKTNMQIFVYFMALNMFLPGKKLMFMGQEIGMFGGFDGYHVIDWSVLEFEANKYLRMYVKDLNALYLAVTGIL